MKWQLIRSLFGDCLMVENWLGGLVWCRGILQEPVFVLYAKRGDRCEVKRDRSIACGE